jgi:hypothetical protein
METGTMQRLNQYFERLLRSKLHSVFLFAIAFLLIGVFPVRSFAQQKGQRTYPSAEAAASALFMALDANDEKMILEILGQDAKPIVSTGNMDEDSERHANFVRRYMEMHRLVDEPDGTTTLYIGAENYPLPIPLVRKSGKWYFDTNAAKQEILLRRIGHNELAAIRVCQELVAAQREFHAQQDNVYAAKIWSDPDKKNGLYWPVTEGQTESPIGPLLAQASVGGSGSRLGEPIPFHGYFFLVLDHQGKNASGGAVDYIVNGKMTGGFAFLAYPAQYRETGVTTFEVNQDGVVYQKDLGDKTAELVKSIKEFDPDSSWLKADEEPPPSTAKQK